MDKERGPYEVVSLWEGFEPEVFEEWPTKAEALHSARLNNMSRESAYVRYGVRLKPAADAVEHRS
jgi:hypothetical protein